jgi:hypothetical protein
MTPELMNTLAEHAAGNYRSLVIMAGEMLAGAARRGLEQLDQQLYLQMYASPPQVPVPPKPKSRRATRRR